MNRLTCIFASFVWLVLLGPLLAAAQSESTNVAVRPKTLAQFDLPGLDKRLSIALQDAMNIEDFIRFLALKGGLNVVISKEVTGATKQLNLDDVTVRDALDIVLAANGLAYELKGNIIKIMTVAEYAAQYGIDFYEQKEVKIVELKYASANRVAQMLDSVKSSKGKVVPDDQTGTLVLIDLPDRIQEMMAIVDKAELPSITRVVPTVTKTFILQHAVPEDIKAEVQAALTKDVGTMRVDKRTKTLIVTDVTNAMAKVEQIITAFDRKPKEVFIEAKIIQVTLKNDFRLGINWQHFFDGVNPRMQVKSAGNFAANPSGGRFGTLSLATVTKLGDITAVLDALETMGNTKVLSSPHIAVLDGSEASIKVVENQPYVQLQFESGSTNVVGQQYNFVEIGVSLTVSPRINEEGMITLAIKPEISDISTWYRGAPQEGTPVVRKSFAETSVMVKDEETIIIGGMIVNGKVETEERIPILGRIPVLGALFRFRAEDSVSNELVVFLTPRVITGEEPFSRSKDLGREPKDMTPSAGAAEATGAAAVVPPPAE